MALEYKLSRNIILYIIYLFETTFSMEDHFFFSYMASTEIFKAWTAQLDKALLFISEEFEDSSLTSPLLKDK